MPKIAKELTATEVRRLECATSAKTGEKYNALHPVGGVPGLLLQVTPTGSRFPQRTIRSPRNSKAWSISTIQSRSTISGAA